MRLPIPLLAAVLLPLVLTAPAAGQGADPVKPAGPVPAKRPPADDASPKKAPDEKPPKVDGAPQPITGEQRRLDSLAVIVNGEAITWAEIREPVLDVAGSLEYRSQADRERKLINETVRQLQRVIENKLLVQMARKAGDIRVTSEELDRAVDEQQRAAGSLTEYMRSLQAKGLTLSQAREAERERLLRQKFVQANFFSTPWGQRYRRFSARVSPREIRDYYRRNAASYKVDAAVWLRRATITASAHGGTDKARALAERARKALADGEAPAKVDETLGLGANDLTRPVEDLTSFDLESGLHADVKRWAFAAKEGAVSDVVELAPGVFAVFMVAKKREAATRGFEEVQEEVADQLRSEKSGRLFEIMRARLFREADIRPRELGQWLLRPQGELPIDREVLTMIIGK